MIRGARFKVSEYNPDGKRKRQEARQAAGNCCIRCGHPHDPPAGYVLTTHHLDGDKSNDAWWNLLALCQRCHLSVQSRINPEVPFFFEHSEWFKPYVAGFYAWKYEGRMITRDEAEANREHFLAYERKA